MLSIGGRREVNGTASCVPRQVNGTAADHLRRTFSMLDRRCFVMLGPTRDRRQTCGCPGDESASCREDQQVRTMTAPMPDHPCSRKNPSTLLARTDGERPRSSRNLWRGTEIEDGAQYGGIQQNPRVSEGLHLARKPISLPLQIANRRLTHHASKEIQSCDHPSRLNQKTSDLPSTVIVTNEDHLNNLRMSSTKVDESARRLHLPWRT